MFKTIVKKGNRVLFSGNGPLAGRVTLQPFFRALHRFSLIGMNYGSRFVDDSGEKQVIRYLAQSMVEGEIPVVLDVGANIGHYSLEVLSVFGKDVELYCFEPSKVAFVNLAHNLKSYNNVKIYNFGLGEQDTTATLYSNVAGSVMGSIQYEQLDYLGIKMEPVEEVKLKRLDDFCGENGIGHVHLLKVDVEGSEFSVLQGGMNLLGSSLVDMIQFEFGRHHIDAKVFFKDFYSLLSRNYQIYRILARGLVPINRYDERDEIFVLTNYLAISKGIASRLMT